MTATTDDLKRFDPLLGLNLADQNLPPGPRFAMPGPKKRKIQVHGWVYNLANRLIKGLVSPGTVMSIAKRRGRAMSG